MKIGILWKSFKENEKRYPLFWKHINSLTEDEAQNLFYEIGYPDLDKINHRVKTLSREEIFNQCEMVILPKPELEDYKYFKNNQIIWGWPHTVQGFDITNIAIEKRLTLIAWENMYKWNLSARKEHIFSRNNELAGYASINHFMALKGITPGVYGENKKIAILGFGSTARGAINALLGLGATDITVFSKRNKFEIADAIKNIKYNTYLVDDGKAYINNEVASKELLNYDIIVNCVLQNPIDPIIFVNEDEIVNKQLLIIDISCDKGMGFDFAVPTSFEVPLVENEKYIYYAVDHSPSYFWHSASVEISGALIPFLKHFIKTDSYKGNVTLERAVDVLNGKILNDKIIAFQKRDKEYPHILISKLKK